MSDLVLIVIPVAAVTVMAWVHRSRWHRLDDKPLTPPRRPFWQSDASDTGD